VFEKLQRAIQFLNIVGTLAVGLGVQWPSAVRDFLAEEDSVAVGTPAFTTMPAGLAIPAFFMLRKLGLNRR
jgi:hypothetical protein